MTGQMYEPLNGRFKTAVGILFSALLLVACSKKLSVEQGVIASLENMENAAEEGRHLDFMAYVAEGFGAQYGSMDRREFHRFMIFQMNENRRLHANFFPIHVQETGESGATAQFRILVTGGAGLLPDRGQLFEVETDWILDGGDWLLSRADWETVQMSE